MTNIVSISTSPINGGTAISRTTVRIPTASGDELEAWLYLPEGDGPHPVVVMAHGIGAIKAGGLAPFAERFCREGFAAIVFDYRQFGGSTGQPREELSFPRQLEDYSTVIGWAATHPDIDAHRIFAWGTSFAGMYIVELAASDSRLAGAIGQVPLVDGYAAARMAPPVRGLRASGSRSTRSPRLGFRPSPSLSAWPRPTRRTGTWHYRRRPLRGEAHDPEGLNRMA
jgi:predicted acyl esterase